MGNEASAHGTDTLSVSNEDLVERESNTANDELSTSRYTTYKISPLTNLKLEPTPSEAESDSVFDPSESIIRGNQPVVGYLLHKSLICGKAELPTFNDIENPLPVYDWEETPKYIFISHRYLSIGHPDDNYHTKLTIIELILKQMKMIQYVWIDYSCVPSDDAHRVGAFMNLFNVITNAQRVIIIPFRTMSPAKAPVFDLKSYSTRAWCALEYSIILARHPSKIRIARILDVNQGSDYKLQFISLPTHDKTLGVDHLVSGMYKLRKILEEDDQREFLNCYFSTADSDRDIIWDLLKMQQRDIFDLAGVRRNSDFFVRTKFASKFSAKNDEKLIEIYDKRTIAEMNQGPCSTGPLDCIVSVCGGPR